MMECKICGQNSKLLFEKKIINKYDIKYYQCQNCEYLFTESPYWLQEAYSSEISTQDFGLIYRNSYFTPIVRSIIKYFFDKKKSFIDYGGGYGIFVRMMRDSGYDFFRFDTYCKNLFAVNFEHTSNRKYELATAFEVFEHLENPMIDIAKILKLSDNIFFSTELQPKDIMLEDWWYIMPESGQHISIYSLKTLTFIANKFNLNLYTNGSSFHLLTPKKISNVWFKALTHHRLNWVFNIIVKNPKSLLMKDFNTFVKSQK